MIKKNINASVIFHTIKLSETWKKNGDVLTKQFGITTQQWFILLLLANDPNIIYLQQHPQSKPLMAKELADALNVSRANITNLLNVLIEKDLITQTEDGIDRRRKRLKLTRKREKVVMEPEDIRHKKNAKILSKFTKQDKEQFIWFADTCLEMMKK
ncbi:MAG: MarR family transcriptional regulator [Chitinophagaceae bacterium]|nr:MarR family transcriptional regulator [Chitinophagaceae bacterium]